MRLIALLLLFAVQLSAQPRINQPLPIISKKPIATLKRGVKGWSLSKDGQWVSDKRTIPMNLNSLDKQGRYERGNSIGLDNFKELRIYPVISGHDTLVLLTKLYESGYYKYKKSENGWKKIKKCHYFIFHKSELSKLDALKDSLVQDVHLKMLDNGEITYEYKAQILTKIKQQLVISDKHGYDFVASLQPFTQDNKLRFQLYALHKDFGDVKGVIKDVKVKGETVYGTPLLFEKLYYETDIDTFSSFFKLPESFKFKL